MGTFGTIVKGRRARKRSPELTTMDGVSFSCDLRALVGVDDADVFARAREYAQSKGIASPKDGEPLYELGIAVHTLALACVDPESPEAEPRPFFDGGVEQILAHLDRDRILYLYEVQRGWQSSFSPRASDFASFEERVQAIWELANAEEDDERPFARLGAGLHRSLLRTLARQWLISLGIRSLSGSADEPPTTSAGSHAGEPPPAPAVGT